jgi:hypothetical protein
VPAGDQVIARASILTAFTLACSSASFEIAEPSPDDGSITDSVVSGDTGPGPETTVDGCVPNACGGCAALKAPPMETCGSCGVYRCEGRDAVVCEDKPKNACGGCADLPAKLGDPCATCGGTVVCDGIDKVKCSGGAAKNLCGGCATLTAKPNDPCGTCGKYICMGVDAVTCKDPGKNVCGGCVPLTGKPGDACGTCGKLACNGTDALKCVDGNGCGGCGILGHEPGSACYCSGKWTCMGINSVECVDGCGIGSSCCFEKSPPICTLDACGACCMGVIDAG